MDWFRHANLADYLVILVSLDSSDHMLVLTIALLTFGQLKQKQRILVAPLDWGLGHAARCVPIIQDLSSEYEIIIAASGRSKYFLQQLFPELICIHFEGYNITYPANGSMAVKMLLQMPKVLKRVKEEHLELQQLIQQYKIDLIISDNRFGLHSNSIPSIYIAHQIHIQAPGILADRLFKLHAKYISQYSQCWIPDLDTKPNLSGSLGHGKLLDNCRYIGPLSRLQKVKCQKIHDYCALISGPEPQRTKFESLILSVFKGRKETLLLLGGKPEEQTTEQTNNITVISHQNDEDLARSISSSSTVIARSGYSSIMDLAKLEAPCIFIPTPGQTEQQYLAEYHNRQYQTPWIRQVDLNWKNLSQVTANKISINWEEKSFAKMIQELIQRETSNIN